MPEPKRVGSLEISEDMPLEKKKWAIERVGWVVMLLLMAAALAGLLGPGPLSETIAGTKGSALWAEYNRFDRYQGPTELQIHIGQMASAAPELRLWLDRSFVERIEITRIDPEPERVELAGDRMVFVFANRNPNLPSEIIFHYEGNKFGSAQTGLGIEGGPELKIKQLMYP